MEPDGGFSLLNTSNKKLGSFFWYDHDESTNENIFKQYISSENIYVPSAPLNPSNRR